MARGDSRGPFESLNWCAIWGSNVMSVRKQFLINTIKYWQNPFIWKKAIQISQVWKKNKVNLIEGKSQTTRVLKNKFILCNLVENICPFPYKSSVVFWNSMGWDLQLICQNQCNSDFKENSDVDYFDQWYFAYIMVLWIKCWIKCWIKMLN